MAFALAVHETVCAQVDMFMAALRRDMEVCVDGGWCKESQS